MWQRCVTPSVPFTSVQYPDMACCSLRNALHPAQKPLHLLVGGGDQLYNGEFPSMEDRGVGQASDRRHLPSAPARSPVHLHQRVSFPDATHIPIRNSALPAPVPSDDVWQLPALKPFLDLRRQVDWPARQVLPFTQDMDTAGECRPGRLTAGLCVGGARKGLCDALVRLMRCCLMPFLPTCWELTVARLLWPPAPRS